MSVRNNWLRLGRIIALSAMAAVISMATGCETLGQGDKRAAANDDPIPAPNGLMVELRPANGDEVIAGQRILFEVTLTNTGPEEITVPREPFISMKWRYPNRDVDGLLPPDLPLPVSGAVTLKPRDTLRLTQAVGTRHMARNRRHLGAISFRAAYCYQYNPAPGNSPRWLALSNTARVVVTAE